MRVGTLLPPLKVPWLFHSWTHVLCLRVPESGLLFLVSRPTEVLLLRGLTIGHEILVCFLPQLLDLSVSDRVVHVLLPSPPLRPKGLLVNLRQVPLAWAHGSPAGHLID